MSADERELTVRDIQDEETYFQYQCQEQAKLLDADSAAYEELKPLLAEWNADKGKNEEEAENKIREYLKKHNKEHIFTPNQYIDNQGQWGTIKFGLTDMAYAGCEIMATYNAQLSLGEDMDEVKLAELIEYYETHGITLGGLLGTSPYAVLDYFDSRGYDVDFTTSLQQEEINRIGEECDTTIITLHNQETDLFNGQVHTVNVEKSENGIFIVHNSRGSTFKGESLWDVIVHMGGQDDAPICIIGINNPKESEAGGETKTK